MAQVYAFIGRVVDQIINPLILLMAAVAFVVFVWGVFEFIRNAGDAKAREEGQRAIFWGLVGLVIIFGAYGIINVVLDTAGLPNIQPHSFTHP
ncbi:MAG TPA: hypothetical protein VMT80_01045 [Candidatus Paceibacterota bacterium]|nr:hypothetical protein [Candidatus Paceibacterota bacterium]